MGVCECMRACEHSSVPRANPSPNPKPSPSPSPSPTNDEPLVAFPKPQITLCLLQGQLLTLAYALNYFFPLSSSAIPPPSLAAYGSNLLSPPTIAIGLLGTLPLLLLALVCHFIEKGSPALQRVSRTTEYSVLRLLGPSSSISRAVATGCLLGITAGVTEEILFRCFLLQKLQGFGLGFVGANLLTSVLFALGHRVSNTYALLAFIASIYFGFLFGGTNIYAAIFAHAVYDAIAVVWCARKIGKDKALRASLMAEFE